MPTKTHAWRPAALLAAVLGLVACQPGADPVPGTELVPGTGADAATEYTPGDVRAPPWLNPLSAAVAGIDADMPGRFGVYVRHLGEAGGSLDLGGERAWYLAGTLTVPVAIAVLERVDAGALSLDEELELREADFVDGPGKLLSRQPGERFSIAALLEKSLREGDSTATDMLVRQIGEVDINRRVRDWLGRGFGPITTALQMHYDAYGALHPGVVGLSNLELLGLRQAGDGEARLVALAGLLGVERADLDAESAEAVFDRYYATGANSAPLEMFADLLELLVTGQLLSPESTALLLGHLGASGDGRGIGAGLPAGTQFAHRTGSRVARACNVGVIRPQAGAQGATIVVACAEGHDDPGQAEDAFKAFGRALADAGLAG